MSFTFDIDGIKEAARSFSDTLGTPSVIAFHGQMGAGKTTFITALCKQLGVHDTIGSPTYSIINQYKTSTGKTIYHMDWYRLRDEEEAIAAGVEEALYSGDPCFVEWPEKAAALLPDATLHVTISLANNNLRVLHIHKKD